ncbi:protein VirD4 [Steroidobacter agaridevorans]|uniref:Protein VirD4 n=1 Tax=Steroidobacter agaridevorans TaxID=2695856 RepID=A0A829YI34_9GAMM|nr:type IV secretory system conjugative DNA transfer family protein [Steroidobacter agaridevorans]GFE82482.1 protein VirD4 [Steroidobacter agaridevorans]
MRWPPHRLLSRATYVRVALAAFFAIGLSQYLAGYLFLWSFGMNPAAATPLTVVRYAYYFSDDSRVAMRVKVSWVGTALCATAALIVCLWPRPRPLHGEAAFASRQEIEELDMLGEEGILLGEYHGRYLILPGQRSVLVAAPSRSGKGVGIMIPNLLHWPGSVVALDVKHENWRLTAGYRQKMGQQCFLFSPLDAQGRTARWNPFTYVSRDPELRISDLQLIADMLIPDEGSNDPFWPSSGRSFFLGLALYVFETPGLPRTIGEVLRQGMGSHAASFGGHWKAVIEQRAMSGRPLSPQCVRALSDVVDLAPATASSIRKTFTSRLEMWTLPLIDAATSADDFDLRQLRRRPISIYIGIKPHDLRRLRPLLAVFYQQCIALQTEELPEDNPELRLQLLMAMDEFTAPGRIPIIADAIPYLGGYNVRTLMLIQTPSQLRGTYGPDVAETITKNLGAHVVFAPRGYADAKQISEDLGYTTVRVKTYSRPRHRGLFTERTNDGSVNVSEQRRALLLPQEVQGMGRAHAIVFHEGTRPILCRKIRYYSDRRFKERLCDPPIVPCRRVRSHLVALETSSNPAGAAPMNAISASVPQHNAVSGEREAFESVTPKDIERWDALRLEDFSADFSSVDLPDRDLTPDELAHAVDQFMSTLRQ